MRARSTLLFATLLLAVAGCATVVDPQEDLRMEAEVKARLVAQKDANLTRLGVVCSQATIYLSGTVVSEDQRRQAQAIATGVPGVRRVVNSLEVRPPPR